MIKKNRPLTVLFLFYIFSYVNDNFLEAEKMQALNDPVFWPTVRFRKKFHYRNTLSSMYPVFTDTYCLQILRGASTTHLVLVPRVNFPGRRRLG